MNLWGFSQAWEAHRLSEALNFDGHLKESFWEDVKPFPLVQHSPDFEQAITQGCDMYLVYDDEYLYLVGDMRYTDPSYYRATTFKRDALDGSTDFFGLVIDSYRDNENAVAFFTTPTEMRWDASVSDNATGPNPVNMDWNSHWEVKCRKTTNGWTSEIRIPWSTLRFQPKNDKLVMGITAWWYSAAINEVAIFPAVSPYFGDWSGFQASQTHDVEFDPIQRKKPVYLTPYLLAGYSESNTLNDAETEYIYEEKFQREVGLDVKYALNSQFTLDLTLNTDFAQVEVDDQQVNLTQFSLFFPEKRPFFQERSSAFDLRFAGNNRVFYSRRIGIEDDKQVRIYGGARLVGRYSGHDIGIMSLQTEKADGKGSNNMSVARVKKQVFNENSYVGAIVTNKTDFGKNYNTTLGLDGYFRIGPTDFLKVKYGRSIEDSLSLNWADVKSDRIFVNFEKFSNQGILYDVAFNHVGKDYNPEMGFETKENYWGVFTGVGYGWAPEENSNFIISKFFLATLFDFSHDYGDLIFSFISPSYTYQSKAGWGYTLGVNHRFEYVEEEFDLSDDVNIPVGEYRWTNFNFNTFSSFSSPIGLEFNSNIGGFFDGFNISGGVNTRFQFSKYLSLNAGYQFNHGLFEDRQKTFVSHLGNVRVFAAFNTKWSLSGFFQANSVDKLWGSNIRLRYNPREGNDLYLVYNEGVNFDLIGSERPLRPRLNNRSIQLKYTYTFIL